MGRRGGEGGGRRSRRSRPEFTRRRPGAAAPSAADRRGIGAAARRPAEARTDAPRHTPSGLSETTIVGWAAGDGGTYTFWQLPEGCGRGGRRGWELARVAADTSAHDAALPLGGWGGGARATAACPPARSQEAGLPTAVARPRAPELRQPDHVGARQGATEAQRVPQQPDLTRTVGDCSGRRGSAAGTPRRRRGQIRERCPRSSPPLPTGTGLVPGSRSRPSRRGGGGGPHWSHAPQVVWIYGHGARLLLASHAPRDPPSLPPVQESANG